MEKIIKPTWKNVIIVIVLFYVVGGLLFICGLLFGKGLSTYNEYRDKVRMEEYYNSPEYLKQQKELDSMFSNNRVRHYEEDIDKEIKLLETNLEK